MKISRFYLILLVLAPLLFLIVVRLYLPSARYYKEAIKREGMGDKPLAIMYYERAIHLYFPFNPYFRKAGDRLLALAERSEKEGDTNSALMAYQRLRGSLYSVRSFFTPRTDLIAMLDESIARLIAKNGRFPKRFNDLSYEKKRSMVIKTLKKDLSPGLFWTIILEVGLFGWIASVILFISQGLNQEGTYRRRIIWGASFLISYMLWLIGMLKA